MNTCDDLTETNRNILSDTEDINLLKSLVGHRCLVKSNSSCQSYDNIMITGYADGVVRYIMGTNMSPMYTNRYDFFSIIMRMPNFENNSREIIGNKGCPFTY